MRKDLSSQLRQQLKQIVKRMVCAADSLIKAGLLSEEDARDILNNLDSLEDELMVLAEDIELRSLDMVIEAQDADIGELLPHQARIAPLQHT